jgi:hypothetical protein
MAILPTTSEKKMKKKFSVSINDQPGFDWVGAKESRTEVRQQFQTRKEAQAFAQGLANWGAPATQQFAALVLRHKGIAGWVVVSQVPCDVWED